MGFHSQVQGDSSRNGSVKNLSDILEYVLHPAIAALLPLAWGWGFLSVYLAANISVFCS